MGIPSYFSHIIKNYANVLQKYNKMFKVDNLYIDSNSIIYDCMRDIEFNGNVIAFEKKLINNESFRNGRSDGLLYFNDVPICCF